MPFVFFFFTREKKKRHLGKIDIGGVFPTHFLVSMVLLIWVTFHTCQLLILCWKNCFTCAACFDAKADVLVQTFCVLVLLCHHPAFYHTKTASLPFSPSDTGLYATKFVFLSFDHIHDIASYLGLGFYCLLFLEQPF